MNFVKSIIDGVLFFVIIALVPFAWILRDGLGPESITTTGINAITRTFFTFYSGYILIGLILLSRACRLIEKKN